MFEIRLIPFTANNFSVANVPASTPAQTATDVPPSLAVLPVGTLLKGFVLNRDADGNPVLRTPQGDFLLQSKLFLRIGSEVTVQVDASGRNFRAHLVSVDGHTPGQIALQDAAAEIEDSVFRSPLTNASSQRGIQTAGSGEIGAASTGTAKPVLSGTVLLPSALLAQASAGRIAVAGLPLDLTVVETLLPPVTTQPLKRSLTSSSSGAADLGETDGEPILPASDEGMAHEPVSAGGKYAAYGKPVFQAPGFANSGAALQAQVQELPVEAIQAFVQSSGKEPLSFLASVLGQEPTGEPLLQSPLGLLRLNAPALPVGMQLRLSAVLGKMADDLSGQSALLVSLAAGSWPMFQTLINALGEDADADMKALLSSILFSGSSVPDAAEGQAEESSQKNSVSPGFGSHLLAFFSAVKSGDIRQFLSPRFIQKLEARGFHGFLQALTQDFAQLHQAYLDSLPQTWQSFYFPIMEGGELQMARFFFRRGKKQSSVDPESPPQDYARFVVELSPSALGEMQMDGLVHWQEGEAHNTRFDLIIRTHAPLPPEAYQEIMAIYHNTGELTGYRGRLQFQVGPDFPVHPLEDSEGGHGEVLA